MNFSNMFHLLIFFSKMLSFQYVTRGAGEMAQRLQALTALVEDPGLSPSTHMTSQNHYNPSSKGSDAFFWLPCALGTHMMLRHTYRQNTCAHKIK